jgi:hypothetical protein
MCPVHPVITIPARDCGKIEHPNNMTTTGIFMKYKYRKNLLAAGLLLGFNTFNA